jgi:hypothetical protein
MLLCGIFLFHKMQLLREDYSTATTGCDARGFSKKGGQKRSGGQLRNLRWDRLTNLATLSRELEQPMMDESHRHEQGKSNPESVNHRNASLSVCWFARVVAVRRRAIEQAKFWGHVGATLRAQELLKANLE